MYLQRGIVRGSAPAVCNGRIPVRATRLFRVSQSRIDGVSRPALLPCTPRKMNTNMLVISDGQIQIMI